MKRNEDGTLTLTDQELAAIIEETHGARGMTYEERFGSRDVDVSFGDRELVESALTDPPWLQQWLVFFATKEWPEGDFWVNDGSPGSKVN